MWRAALMHSRLGDCRRTIPTVIVALPYPHQGTDDIWKIILVGTDHSQDDSHPD
jgi:hypothetical protein